MPAEDPTNYLNGRYLTRREWDLAEKTIDEDHQRLGRIERNIYKFMGAFGVLAIAAPFIAVLLDHHLK